MGGSEKLKKGWKYGAGKGLFKRGAGSFPIYFVQGLSLLHFTFCIILLYIWRKIFFFCQLNFMKNSKLSKNELVCM